MACLLKYTAVVGVEESFLHGKVERSDEPPPMRPDSDSGKEERMILRHDLLPSTINHFFQSL